MAQDSHFNFLIESGNIEPSLPGSAGSIGTEHHTSESRNNAIATEKNKVLENHNAISIEYSAEERTAQLFESMAPQRRVLLGILAYCNKRQGMADVKILVSTLYEETYSVYSAENLCALLEKAGALERITCKGGLVGDDALEPVIAAGDGESTMTCWVTTLAGRAMLESDKPWERLKTLFEDDSPYRVIYKHILMLYAVGDGASTLDVSSAIDGDPLLENPRLYAAYFIAKLEKADAIAWKNKWEITEIGKKGLEFLSDVKSEIVEAKGLETLPGITATNIAKADMAEEE